jgi:post-segregation antitoxin (ccd killing protein)
MKQKVTLLIDAEIVQKAKQSGINLSGACEYALCQITNSIQTINFKNNPNLLNECSFAKENSKPRAGVDPATYGLQE